MTFKEWKDSIRAKVMGQADGLDHNEIEPNLANGGTSGYKPNQFRGKDLFSTQGMSRTTMEPMTREQADPWQAGYQQQTQMQPQGWNVQPMQNAQPTGTVPMNGQPNQWGHPMSAPAEMQSDWGVSASQGQTDWQPPMQQQSVPNNISYLSGNFVGNDGKAYSHVERVAQLNGVSACFRIIEFMRNGESVIINMEAVMNDVDVQRCLDMISGAAFTLGCSMTRITQTKRAYLVAPSAVLVMQDAAVAHWTDTAVDEKPAYAMPQANSAYGTTPRASIFTSQNAPVRDDKWADPAAYRNYVG